MMINKYERDIDNPKITPEATLGATTADRVLAIIEGYLESSETIPPALVPFNMDLMNLAGEYQDLSAIRALGEPRMFNEDVDRTFTTLASLNILYYRSGEGFTIENEQQFQILREEAVAVLGQEDYEVLKELGKNLGEKEQERIEDNST